jgi:hypothetical protein
MQIVKLVLACILLSLMGCYGSSSSLTKNAPDAIGDFNPYEPIDAEKINLFIKVMEALPAGKIPDFNPPKVPAISHDLTASNFAEKYQQQLKLRVDPNLFANSWRDNTILREAANKQGLSLQEFAALMIQVSLAYTSESLGDKMNILQSWKEGEKLEDEQISLLDEITNAKLPLTDPDSARKRDVYFIKLEFALAQCFFCELLYNVPLESKQVIKPALSRLKQFLPDPSQQIPVLSE